MLTVAVVVLTAMVVAEGSEATPPPAPPGHLRCLSNASRDLAIRAAERSPVVRRLIEDIERSDVVVYLEILAAPQTHQFRASMRFVAWTGGIRYLLVQIDGFGINGTDQVALLGHELCHALEVAADLKVRDPASFQKFYQRIGTGWGSCNFETANARATERRVRDELAQEHLS
jgi:hypothetical protein